MVNQKKWETIASADTFKINSALPVRLVTNSFENQNFIQIVLKTNCPQDSVITAAIANVTITEGTGCGSSRCIRIDGPNVTPNIIGANQCNTFYVDQPPSTSSILLPFTFISLLLGLFLIPRNSGLWMQLLFFGIFLGALTSIFTPMVEAQGVGCSLWVDVIVSQKNCAGWGGTVISPNNVTNEFRSECIMDGRPYETDSGYLRATEGTGSGWILDDLKPSVDGLSEDERRQLADHWTDVALAEHSSIASFSKFSLQLLAIAAPSDLIQRAHLAAMDEVRHAQLAFSLATAFRGTVIAPGEFQPHVLSIQPNLVQICESTAREGCVVETLSTLSAAADLTKTTDPAIQRALSVIIQDESKHSALAWDTVRWCISREKSLARHLNQTIVEAIQSHPDRVPYGTELIEALTNAVVWGTPSKLAFETKKEGSESIAIAENIYQMVVKF